MAASDAFRKLEPMSHANPAGSPPSAQGGGEVVVVDAGAVVYIVVSCPERGSLKPDGSGPYEQEVMTKLMELQGLGRIKIAFDRAVMQYAQDGFWGRGIYFAQDTAITTPRKLALRLVQALIHWLATSVRCFRRHCSLGGSSKWTETMCLG